MEEKELIINNEKELRRITNKEAYTKLVLNCEVNPKLLSGFNNIKEFTISSENLKSNHINEQYINDYSFVDKLEIINFINIDSVGTRYNPNKRKNWERLFNFSLKCKNLKKINFKYNEVYIEDLYIHKDYFQNSDSLEEIKIDVPDQFWQNNILFCPKNLKKIIVNIGEQEYDIDLLYSPKRIEKLCFYKKEKDVCVEYTNECIRTNVDINLFTNKKREETCMEELNDIYIKNNSLYIPDYVTNCEFDRINYKNKIEDISFNINLLNSIKRVTRITDNNFLDILKTITIRSNSDMSLYPNRVINVNDIGELKDLYIEDNKLHIVYDEIELVVDKDLVITKESLIDDEEIIEETQPLNNGIDLDKYTISELEQYLQYRKLVEKFRYDNDEEVKDAIEVMGKVLAKKLNKGE